MSHDHEEHDHDHDHDHNMTNTTDPCAAEHLEDYDLPLHIAAIFIVFAASALGVLIPIIMSRLKQRKIFTTVLVLGKCFGTGVILATALIHILPEAAETLHGECLPEWFHEYHGVSGLFCLIAVLVMHLIEWSVLVSTTPVEGKEVNEAEERDEHSHALLLTNQRQHNIATYSLELGIMVHSIIIGIALGLSTEEFHALFIAICFHQFFEGFALGALIAQVDYSHIVLAFTNGAAYAITTPVGVAIGIGIRDGATDPVASDIAIGIFESLAAGLLIYSVLVNLFAAFRQSEFLNLSKIEKFSGFLFFYLGAAVMATLGIWA